jgi:hypothetical protein
LCVQSNQSISQVHFIFYDLLQYIFIINFFLFLIRRVREIKKLVGESKIHLDSWNVGFLIDKLRELVDIAIRRRVNILCVQETKWMCQKAKEVENTDFKLWYTEKE